MKIDTLHRVDITLFDADIQTMREIVRLAHERIHTCNAVRLRGVPLERQAGLVVPELFQVKEAIKKIGHACGISLPYEPESTQGTGTSITNNKLELL